MVRVTFKFTGQANCSNIQLQLKLRGVHLFAGRANSRFGLMSAVRGKLLISYLHVLLGLTRNKSNSNKLRIDSWSSANLHKG